MIQFRRGSTRSWKNTNIKLADGQPGYDKDKHEIKIGDGEHLWADLPPVGGLSAEEILDSEANAKIRLSRDPDSEAIITYGQTAPDNNTVGQLYLQQSNSDYIIDSKISDGWVYHVYKSGIIKCFGNFKVDLDITDTIEGTGLYCGSISFRKSYPKTFKNPPVEVVSLQGSNGMAWLANKGTNTVNSSGIYDIISTASKNNVEYTISIHVDGIKA